MRKNKYSVIYSAYGVKWSYNTPYLVKAVLASIRHGFAPIERIVPLTADEIKLLNYLTRANASK